MTDNWKERVASRVGRPGRPRGQSVQAEVQAALAASEMREIAERASLDIQRVAREAAERKEARETINPYPLSEAALRRAEAEKRSLEIGYPVPRAELEARDREIRERATSEPWIMGLDGEGRPVLRRPPTPPQHGVPTFANLCRAVERNEAPDWPAPEGPCSECGRQWGSNSVCRTCDSLGPLQCLYCREKFGSLGRWTHADCFKARRKKPDRRDDKRMLFVVVTWGLFWLWFWCCVASKGGNGGEPLTGSEGPRAKPGTANLYDDQTTISITSSCWTAGR